MTKANPPRGGGAKPQDCLRQSAGLLTDLPGPSSWKVLQVIHTLELVVAAGTGITALCKNPHLWQYLTDRSKHRLAERLARNGWTPAQVAAVLRSDTNLISSRRAPARSPVDDEPTLVRRAAA